ncbi:MAG TPA: Gfo/Idh/MocA family oxidoreductase [Candidatus Mediterraneibacter surreyensis]|nr:Gfo/Idh/MocA family oxidoreductase [Candidatus Mediterraneibacter surreyensis]
MIGVGIIGCGRIAQERHLPEYQENPYAKIIGVFDVNMERAEEIAAKYSAKAYPSYEELLKDPRIEAVSVCSANNTHAEISVAALKAGKHVLCEKPMAVTYEECEAMTKAAEESGKYLMIGQNQRLTKAHVKAKEMIREGLIGKVLTFRTTFGHGGPETWSIDPGKKTWFFDKKRAAMGAMADLGIHKTDLIQYLLSQKITETTAKLTTLDKRGADGELIGVDDNAICIYKLSDGTIGTMTASWTYYGAEDNSTVLYGTEGILRIYDDPEHAIVLIGKDGTRKEYDVEAIQTNDNQTKSGVIDLFIDSLEKGMEPPVSGASVLHAMKAVFASIESSKEGRTIVIDNEDQ